MAQQSTIREQIVDRLTTSAHNVFFRKDFADLSSYS
jgi:hypothetical protein